MKTKGPPVTGRHRQTSAETVWDQLACEGASLARRTARTIRWGAALARACSVFLRKMVIGDRRPRTRRWTQCRSDTHGLRQLQRIPAGDLEVISAGSDGPVQAG